MKIKEQTIQALNELSSSEIMLVHEWIEQLKSSHSEIKKTRNWKISYEELHSATRGCNLSFSDEVIKQREDRI